MATFNTELREGVITVIDPQQFKVIEGKIHRSTDYGDSYHPYFLGSVVDCDNNIHMLSVAKP